MREQWTLQEWVVTLLLCIVFPPIGVAAVLRRQSGKRVWR